MERENLLLADKSLEGKTIREISAETNIPIATVHRKLNKAETKDYIEKVQQQFYVESLQKSADNVIHVIGVYRSEIDHGSTDALSYQRREHGFKGSLRVLESAGILSGANQSQYFISIFNSQTNILSPMIQAILSQAMSDPTQAKVIDAEFYAST